VRIYLDTSAIVPLLIEEPTSPACALIWAQANEVIATRLLYVETSAALTRAVAVRRISSSTARAAQRTLADLWSQITVAELDEALMVSAASLGRRFGLRGYDAVHVAAAVEMDDPLLIGVSGDEAVLLAWRSLGTATFDPSS